MTKPLKHDIYNTRFKSNYTYLKELFKELNVKM